MTSSPERQPIEPIESREAPPAQPAGEPIPSNETQDFAAAQLESSENNPPAFPLGESAEPRVMPTELQLPPDLRAPWTARDIILFALFYLLSPFVVALPIFIAAAVARHGDLNSVMNDKQFQAVLSIVAQAVAALLTLGYLWVLVKAKNAGAFWEAIGWRQLSADAHARRRLVLAIIGGGISLAVVVTMASSFIGQKKSLPIEELVQTRQAMILLMTFGVLVAPLVEETVFRGVLYPVIARRLGIGASVLVTGVLFGMVHALQLWGGWGQIALIVAVGILLTWIRANRHTVWASYLLHLSYNSTLFLGAFYATGGFRHMENMK